MDVDPPDNPSQAKPSLVPDDRRDQPQPECLSSCSSSLLLTPTTFSGIPNSFAASSPPSHGLQNFGPGPQGISPGANALLDIPPSSAPLPAPEQELDQVIKTPRMKASKLHTTLDQVPGILHMGSDRTDFTQQMDVTTSSLESVPPVQSTNSSPANSPHPSPSVGSKPAPGTVPLLSLLNTLNKQTDSFIRQDSGLGTEDRAFSNRALMAPLLLQAAHGLGSSPEFLQKRYEACAEGPSAVPGRLDSAYPKISLAARRASMRAALRSAPPLTLALHQPLTGMCGGKQVDTTTHFQEFLQRPAERVLFINGASGSGKTFLALALTTQLLAVDSQRWFPLYVSLREIADLAEQSTLLQLLSMEHGMEHDELVGLLNSSQLCTSSFSADPCVPVFVLCVRVKIVALGQAAYSATSWIGLQTSFVELQPLQASQIENYLSGLEDHISAISPLSIGQCLDLLRSTPAVHSLLSSPLILSYGVYALHTVHSGGQDVPPVAIILSQVEFCRQFAVHLQLHCVNSVPMSDFVELCPSSMDPWWVFAVSPLSLLHLSADAKPRVAFSHTLVQYAYFCAAAMSVSTPNPALQYLMLVDWRVVQHVSDPNADLLGMLGSVASNLGAQCVSMTTADSAAVHAFGRVLVDLQQFVKAAALYQKLLQLQRVDSDATADLITTMEALVGVYVTQGAERAFPQFIAVFLLITVPCPAFVRIARDYTITGVHIQQIDLVVELYGLLHNLVGPSDARTHRISLTLADIHLQSGTFAEAEYLFCSVLGQQEQHESPELDLVPALLGMGDVAHARRHPDQAIKSYNRVLDIQLKHLVKSSPDAASTFEKLAVVYASEGKYKQVEKMLHEGVDILKSSLGPNSPMTLQLIAWRADTLVMIRDFAMAGQCYQGALTAQKVTLGADHPQTLSTMVGLAHLKALEGEYGAAEALYRSVLDQQTASLGQGHLDTATTMQGLAYVELQTGHANQAYLRIKSVLTVQNRELGSDHSDTAESLLLLGLIYLAMNRPDKALGHLTTVFSHRERKLKLNHPETVEAAHHLIKAYVASEVHPSVNTPPHLVPEHKVQDAENLCSRLLASQTAAVGPMHLSSMRTRRTLMTLYKSGDLPQDNGHFTSGHRNVSANQGGHSAQDDQQISSNKPHQTKEEHHVAFLEERERQELEELDHTPAPSDGSSSGSESSSSSSDSDSEDLVQDRRKMSLGLTSAKVEILWLPSDSILQKEEVVVALRTGLCGSLTTFASWMAQMIQMSTQPRVKWSASVVETVFGLLLGITLPLMFFLIGTHTAQKLQRKKVPSSGGASRRQLRLLVGIGALAYFTTLILSAVMYSVQDIGDSDSDEKDFIDWHFWLALVFAPAGSTVRWVLAPLNRQSWICPGTLVCNILGTLVSVTMLGLVEFVPKLSEGYFEDALLAVVSGFCGSLST
eukprot:gene3147-608_t